MTQSIDQPLGLFIDGESIKSENEATIEVINPSNGKHFLSIAAGSEADVDCAVASARRALEDGRWCEAPPSFRKKALHEWAALIASESGELDALDGAEMGKPVRETLGNGAAAAGLVRFYAESVDKVTGDVYVSDTNSFVTQRRVPRGVIAAITPWNFPTYNAALKLAPALAAGNCVVLKPSELSSRSAIRLAQLALRAGVPAGVLNVVPGLGEIVGRALALHRNVDMVAFTGSTGVGKLMLQYAGQSNMKVVMAECGGKSPHIIFDDCCDLDSVSDVIARSVLANQGQICSIGSRLLVHRSIETRMLERIAARMREVVIGSALDPKTTFGPLASAKQCARVMQYIETARAEGAELTAGGRRVLGETGGFFVEPTLFCNVSPAARISREEIFGPVLTTTSFQDEAEAVHIANDTTYGLAAYVWTTDISRGLRMAKAIRSSVRINSVAPIGEGPGYAASSEPARESGIGTEGGLAGMESYMRRQRVWINHG